MGMMMRHLFNIQMSWGLISKLDLFCNYYELWKRNLVFVSCKGCLIMSYKMNSLNSLCEGVLGVWRHWKHKNKWLVQNHSLKNCCYRWIIVWRIIRIDICLFFIIINSKGGLWKGTIGISCHQSCTQRHWWKFWLFVKKIERIK